MKHTTITLMPLKHRGKYCLFFKWDRKKHPHYLSIIKRLPGKKYSRTKNSWYIAKTAKALEQCIALFDKENIRYDLSEIKQQNSGKGRKSPITILLTEEQRNYLTEFTHYLKSNRYSRQTIRTYTRVISTFLSWLKDFPIESINYKTVEKYNYEFILKHNYSISYQNQLVNALKLFVRVCKKMNLNINNLERPRKQRKLPVILSKEEIKKLLDCTPNIKHKAILSTIYACGLRRGEILNLRLNDLNSQRGLMHIVQSKGAKDRVVKMPQKLIDLLFEYYQKYQPKEYLFEGHKGKKYSATSIAKVLALSLKRAGIKKKFTPHCLRHCYAVHLMDKGIHIRYIQEALGHKSLKTTMIYTRVSQENKENMPSPLDFL